MQPRREPDLSIVAHLSRALYRWSSVADIRRAAAWRSRHVSPLRSARQLDADGLGIGIDDCRLVRRLVASQKGVVHFDRKDRELRGGRRQRAARGAGRVVVEECRRGADGGVLVAVGLRGVTELPPLGPPCDQDLVVLVDSEPGCREDPTVVGSTGPRVGGRRSSTGCRSASGNARVRRSRGRRGRRAVRVLGTAARRGCVRASRSRPARCGRSATTCSRRCIHRTARPIPVRPRSALCISASQVEKSPAGKALCVAHVNAPPWAFHVVLHRTDHRESRSDHLQIGSDQSSIRWPSGSWQ